MNKLNGKVALITGASSGIGRATAILFANEGAKVVAVATNIERGEETVSLIKKQGGEAIFVRANVAESKDVQNMVQAAVAKYGRLDVLFNNAGITGPVAPLHESREEDFDKVINTNLRGVYLGMKYGIAQMLPQGGGAIINTGSESALVGVSGLAAYCASKGGIIQITKAAAVEYAKQNIRVNCICPGSIQTPMLEGFIAGSREVLEQFLQRYPMGRIGRPEEIAQTALFLASDDVGFMTGAIISVDGGAVAQ